MSSPEIPTGGVINILESADWAKETLDFLTLDGSRPVETAAELRETLVASGISIDDFKEHWAYKLPLQSGRYPWLKDL